MLAFILAAAITYIFLWVLPLWLLWPAGVLISIYMVTLVERAKGRTISDQQILAALIGSWLTVCYGMMLFLA
ncbi:MAG: hypothetical protein QM372_05155 [Bacillota bacterium]|jgi:hypothetical protein|nr:hypothetical protein [Bacillota bacterium]NLJ03962.1 hypothetical protein [Bacillota bacterium]